MTGKREILTLIVVVLVIIVFNLIQFSSVHKHFIHPTRGITTQAKTDKQHQEVTNVKHLIFLSSINRQRLHVVHNEVSNNSLCEQLPLWISLTFSSSYLNIGQTACLPASSYLKLSCNSMLSYANTLPSSGINAVTFQIYLCRSYAISAKRSFLHTPCMFPTCSL